MTQTSPGEEGGAIPSGRLMELVYAELRAIAGRYVSRRPGEQTLQATALVHEAWLRIVGTDDPGWESRGQFFRCAARAIREILIEQARQKVSVKRGQHARSDVDPGEVVIEEDSIGDDVLKLDQALTQLEARRPQLVQVISLRFFTGLAMPEIAEILQTPLRTIERDWSYARAWLRDYIRHEATT